MSQSFKSLALQSKIEDYIDINSLKEISELTIDLQEKFKNKNIAFQSSVKDIYMQNDKIFLYTIGDYTGTQSLYYKIELPKSLYEKIKSNAFYLAEINAIALVSKIDKIDNLITKNDEGNEYDLELDDFGYILINCTCINLEIINSNTSSK